LSDRAVRAAHRRREPVTGHTDDHKAASAEQWRARHKMDYHTRIAMAHKTLLLQYDEPRRAVRRNSAKRNNPAKRWVSAKLAKLSELAYEAARTLYQESFDEMMLHRRLHIKAALELDEQVRLRPQCAKYDARQHLLEKEAEKEAKARRSKRLREVQDALGGPAVEDARYVAFMAETDAMRWLRSDWPPAVHASRIRRSTWIWAAVIQDALPAVIQDALPAVIQDALPAVI
jgi:hypothetical protein